MKKKKIEKKVVRLFRMNYEDFLKQYQSMNKNSLTELDFEFIQSLLFNCYFTIDEDLFISWHFDEDKLDYEETEGFFSYMLFRIILERNGYIKSDEYIKTLTKNRQKLFNERTDKCTQCKYYRLISRIQ